MGKVGVDKIGSAGGGREEEVGGGLGLPSPGRFFILFYFPGKQLLAAVRSQSDVLKSGRRDP